MFVIYFKNGMAMHSNANEKALSIFDRKTFFTTKYPLNILFIYHVKKIVVKIYWNLIHKKYNYKKAQLSIFVSGVTVLQRKCSQQQDNIILYNQMRNLNNRFVSKIGRKWLVFLQSELLFYPFNFFTIKSFLFFFIQFCLFSCSKFQ